MATIRKFIITRVALTIPIILILLTIVFLILRVLPGDPISAMLGGKAIPPEVLVAKRQALEAELGFDKPLYLQYVYYLADIVRGDFGVSSRTFRPVIEDLAYKFPATIELAIFSMIIAVIIGLLGGVFASKHQNKIADHGIRVFGIAVFSMPIFWLGLIFQLIFCVYLDILPAGGRLSPLIDLQEVTGFYVLDSLITWNMPALVDVLKHLVLPAFTLGLVQSSLLTRMTRVNMIDTLAQDYTSAARARGLPESKVTHNYALRNALIPIVTIMGLQFAILMAGAVLTEATFNWPGIASYLIQGLHNRDFNVIQGTVVFIAIFIALVSLAVDIAYAWLDPRIRY